MATLALFVWSLRRSHVLAFGLGWYFATLLPVMQWIPVGSAMMADRYTYLPYIGLLFILAAGVTAAFLARFPHWRDVVLLGLTFTAAAAVVTVPTYAVILARVGWQSLVVDSWLLLYNMPPEIAYFNAQVSGVANPARCRRVATSS